MQLFKEADLIVQAVEDHLTSLIRTKWVIFNLFFQLQQPASNHQNSMQTRNFMARFFRFVWQIVWQPPKFLTIGFREIMYGPNIWAILVLLLWGGGSWLAHFSGVTAHQVQLDNFLVSTGAIVAFILATFALPSVYAKNGITAEISAFVANYLELRGFKSSQEIDLLKKSIKPFDEACRSRITVLKTVIGLWWAIIVYGITQFFNKMAGKKIDIFDLLPLTFGMIIGVLIFTILVLSYEAAIDKLFRAIEHGCNDFCHAKEKEKQEGN